MRWSLFSIRSRDPLTRKTSAQDHREKPEALAGPNADACSPRKGFTFIVMGHESRHATRGQKDRRPDQDDEADHGEQTPGARDPEPESLIGPGQCRPDQQPDSRPAPSRLRCWD
mgnify:CR=1 FL=1